MNSNSSSLFFSDLSPFSGSVSDARLDVFCDDLRAVLVRYSKLSELPIPQSDYYEGMADAIAYVLRKVGVVYGNETGPDFFNESVWIA